MNDLKHNTIKDRRYSHVNHHSEINEVKQGVIGDLFLLIVCTICVTTVAYFNF